MARDELASTDEIGVHGVAQSLEELRLAEARLERRRHAWLEPGFRERVAARFVFERADAGDPATPAELAAHMGVSRATVTGLIRRLVVGGIVTTRVHATDGRSKLLHPVDRNDHVDGDDPVTDSIREIATGLSDRDAVVVRDFLERLRETVDRMDR